MGLTLPAPRGVPQALAHVIAVEASWERQSYETAQPRDAGDLVREERRRVSARVSTWATSWLRWHSGVAVERHHVAAEQAVDVRLAGDRVAISVATGAWVPLAGGDRFSAGGFLAAWRSATDAARPSWSAVAEFAGTSRAAPLALWPGAGTGAGRSGLIRAHPLLDDGAITGMVFGRAVARSSMEYARPVAQPRGVSIAAAGFVDAARAWRRRGGLADSPLALDAGVGLRVHTGGDHGAIRIDVARGLRGGGTTFSAGWGGAWPR